MGAELPIEDEIDPALAEAAFGIEAEPESDPVPEQPEAAPEADPVLPVDPEPAEEEEASPQTSPQVRDLLSKYGLDTTGYADDDAALQAFSTRVLQAEQAKKYYESQAQQASQPVQTQAPTEKPKYWNPPEYNADWGRRVTVGDNGEITPNYAAGGTPEIAQKVGNYLAYVQDEQTKQQANPLEYITPYVKSLIEEHASSLVDQRLGAQTEEQQVKAFVSENESWIFQYNDRGEPLRDASGGNQLSADGHRFLQNFNGLLAQNVSPPTARKLAMSQLNEARYLQGQVSPTAPPTPETTNAEMKKKFVQSAAGYEPQSSATTNQSPGTDGEASPQNPDLSLDEQIRIALEAAGVQDKDILAFR